MVYIRRLYFVPGRPGTSFFDAICEMDNIVLAHKLASRGKSWYSEVKMVNSDPEFYLTNIQWMLINQDFTTSAYDISIRYDGIKQRTIYKLPYYPDRIVQWAILNVIGPILESKMISTTFSSLKGRGPYQCMKRVSSDLERYPYETFYCLKMDIHKFYQSIDHDLLKQLYAYTFKDPKLLWLINDIIDSVDNDEGIPIGNYLSQYSGNYFLTPFDHWLKEEKHIQFYYRYMDDMVILHHDKEYLHDLLNEIIDTLNKIKLTLKPNHQIFPVPDRGIDFVGYVIKHGEVRIRPRIAKGYKLCVNRLMNKSIYRITDHDEFSYFSHKGFVIHGDTKALLKKYSMPLEKYLSWDRHKCKGAQGPHQ